MDRSKPRPSSALYRAGVLVRLHDVAAQLERQRSLQEALHATEVPQARYDRWSSRFGRFVRRDELGEGELQARFAHRAIRLLSDGDDANSVGTYRLERLADPAASSLDEFWSWAQALTSGHVNRAEVRRLAQMLFGANRDRVQRWLDQAMPMYFGGAMATQPLFSRVVFLGVVHLPAAIVAGRTAESFSRMDRLMDTIQKEERLRQIPAFGAPVERQGASSKGIAYAPWFWAVGAFLSPQSPLALRPPRLTSDQEIGGGGRRDGDSLDQKGRG